MTNIRRRSAMNLFCRNLYCMMLNNLFFYRNSRIERGMTFSIIFHSTEGIEMDCSLDERGYNQKIFRFGVDELCEFCESE